MRQPPRKLREVVEVLSSSMSITHIFDGEEVITAGEDGQVWVATFADVTTAKVFIQLLKRTSYTIKGLK